MNVCANRLNRALDGFMDDQHDKGDERRALYIVVCLYIFLLMSTETVVVPLQKL